MDAQMNSKKCLICKAEHLNIWGFCTACRTLSIESGTAYCQACNRVYFRYERKHEQSRNCRKCSEEMEMVVMTKLNFCLTCKKEAPASVCESCFTAMRRSTISLCLTCKRAAEAQIRGFVIRCIDCLSENKDELKW